MGKYCKNYRLKSLDCQLPYSEDLAIWQNIEVSDNDLPDVVDAADIDKSRLNESTHCKSVDLGEDLTFCWGAGVLASENWRMEVFQNANCELSQSTDQLR